MPKDIPDTRADPLAKPEWAMSPREAERARRAREGLTTRRRRWPWVVLLLLALAAAGAGGWLWWQGREAALVAEAAPQVSEAEAAVQINRDEWQALEPVTLRRTVKVIGPLAPVRRSELSAETSGLIEQVLVRPGDAVEAGQVLVQVDVERLALDLDLARSNTEATRAQLALAEDQLARAEALAERGLSPEATLGEARANVEAQRANLAAQEDGIAAAELALARATVRAPFDGVVAERSVEPGTVVAAGTPLLSVVDLSRMEMLASAPVGAGARIASGQAVMVEVDGVEGRAFEGTVDRIAPVAAEGTRALIVYVTLGNEDGILRGGMFATGRIVVAEVQGAIALPPEAIREDAEGSFVLVLEGDALARRPVTVGEEWEGGLVQVEGLSAGEAVVTAALPELQPGQAVELVEF